MKLMVDVCDLVPESYKERCDDFVDNYGKQIVEFLLSSAAPHTICTLLHLCLFEEQTVPGQSAVFRMIALPLPWTSLSHLSDSLIAQRWSSPRTASPAARWLC